MPILSIGVMGQRPAIDAGAGGLDIGALEYPNVYYVDPRHPGASDDLFGYAGAPFKTIAKACAVAQRGETIVLRGGPHRETIRPQSDGVTIRAMEGEKVTISGADLVTGWRRDGDKWWAPILNKPVKVLMDGQAFDDFSYTTRRIAVSGVADPRTHLFETVVRQAAIDTEGVDVKIEGIETANTLGGGN